MLSSLVFCRFSCSWALLHRIVLPWTRLAKFSISVYKLHVPTLSLSTKLFFSSILISLGFSFQHNRSILLSLSVIIIFLSSLHQLRNWEKQSQNPSHVYSQTCSFLPSVFHWLLFSTYNSYILFFIIINIIFSFPSLIEKLRVEAIPKFKLPSSHVCSQSWIWS